MRREKLNEYFQDLLFAAALTFIVFLGIKNSIPLITTAFAASLYLSFINPYSKYSTPWSISVSYITAAICGIILNSLLSHELAAANMFYIMAIFIMLVIFAETLTLVKAEHPPAAGVLVSFAYTEATTGNMVLFSYLIIIMVIIDYIFERLLEHKKEIMQNSDDDIMSFRKFFSKRKYLVKKDRKNK